MIGRKLRATILAAITMLLSVALIAFGTYALFTDSRNLVVHLNAANLELELVRTNLDYKSLAGDGYEYEHIGENTEEVNFTTATTRNLFDLQEDTLIAPGCWYEATLKINNKGTVAFVWWMDIKLNGDVNALSEQINVTVTECDKNGNELKNEDGSYVNQRSGSLKEDVVLGTRTDPFGHFAVSAENTVAVFKVKVEFKNLDTDGSVNNAAQTQKASFDLIVNAVQEIDNPNAPLTPNP